MAATTPSPDYSKSFRRALRRVISEQQSAGQVDPKSAAVEELFNRADPWTIMTALLETVVVLAKDDRPKAKPTDRIDDAVDRLRRHKPGKENR
jgi:hypothetical protein